MADQTLGAVGALLGVLGKAIKDEGTLLSGVEGDIQFIRDEMDSMDGFLLHLTKTKAEHDDQLRAWMKQVRDITYLADDYISLYMRDHAPREGVCSPLLAKYLGYFFPDSCTGFCHRNLCDRGGLAKKIRALKDRVREVGERRRRYDVKLPEGQAVESPPVSRDRMKKEKRDEFLVALEDGHPPLFQEAVRMLRPADHHPVVKKCLQLLGDDHVNLIKMLLRSLYAHSYQTQELEDLYNKLQLKGDVAFEVMVFCYSKLPVHYKSCLQYLTTFELEESISRTCLVRRWLAEGLVAKDEKEDVLQVHSMEEAGELCLDELVFRGFLSRAHGHHFPRTGGLKLKSCVLGPSVNDFIKGMARSENFVADLPTHLRHQLDIRNMARRKPPQEQRKPWWRSSICIVPRIMAAAAAGDGSSMAADGGGNNDKLMQLHHPMDDMVALLKGLPSEYRLNVLDLGGCDSLKMSHLESICKRVPSLKYLSLRKTNVYQLPKEMTNLLHLETLDIRDTPMRADAMKHIVLQGLKHLLAGHIITYAGETRLSTVLIPLHIWKGKKVEILRHVQIKDGHAAGRQLSLVASQERLRKLGVVLDGTEDNIKLLLTTIARRSDTLRSLSVWITEPPGHIAGGGMFVTIDTKGDTGYGTPLLYSAPNELESLNLKCFKGRSGNTSYIPQWIKALRKLSKITLRDSLLTGEGLRELGKMKSLRCLKLCRESYIEAEVTMKKGEFEELRLLQLDQISNTMTKLVFEQDAAPKLEKIVWNFDTTTPPPMGITVDNIDGITNHKNLKEVKINGVNMPIPSPSSRSREWKGITTILRKTGLLD